MGARETSIEQIVGIIGARAEQSTPPAKYSDWQPVPPADPDFLRRVRRLRWEKAAVAVGLVAAWALLCTLLLKVHGMGVLSGFSSFLATGTAAVWLKTRTRRATPCVADLLDLPATNPQFPVELEYKAIDGYKAIDSTYGTDEGILSFAGGWMHFQGRRTSWSLRATEVLVSRLNAKQRTIFNSAQGLWDKLTWRDGDGSYGISILAIDSVEGLGRGLRKEFERELDRWIARNENPVGNASLPPIEAVPDLPRRLALAHRAAGAIVRVAAVALLVATVGLFESGASVARCAVSLGILGVFLGALIFEVSLGSRVANLARSCVNWPTAPERRPPSAARVLSLRIRAAFGNAKARRHTRELATCRPEGEAVPVEIRYRALSGECRREVGWLKLSGSHLRFSGSLGSWTVGLRNARHRDPAKATSRAYYEEPLPFEQILEIPVADETVTACILPLEIPGCRDSANRLSRLFETEEASVENGDPDPKWLFAPPAPDDVARLEGQFVDWTFGRLFGLPIFFGGIIAVFALAISATDAVVVVIAASVAIFALVMTFVAEGQRESLANRLDSIHLLCEGGEQIVRFRRGQGPWWLRTGPPGRPAETDWWSR